MKIKNKRYLNLFFKFNSILVFTSGIFLYGSILDLNSYCEEKQLDKPLCKIFSNLSRPQAIVTEGIESIRHLIVYKTRSGMLATDIKNAKQRFDIYDAGLNFNYSKGSRKNAGYILLAFADPNKFGSPSIELWDLNKQSMMKSWDLSKAIKLVVNKSKKPVTYFNNPIILDDSSIVFNSNGALFFESGAYLIKLDKNGEIIGFNDKYFFHHSINLDSNGLLYVGINDKNRTTRGDGFAILDQQLNILETHFIEDIYERNDMAPRLFSNKTRDPIHLNDVEPVNEKNKTKTENVLISLRSTSSVLNYDMKTGKIVWILDGLTSQQHDVDVVNINPLEFTVFDNNIKHNEKARNKILFVRNLPLKQSNEFKDILLISPNSTTIRSSNISFNFENFEGLENKLRPFTEFGGLSEYNSLNNSIIVEEENHGRIFEYDLDKNKILWTFYNATKDKDTIYRLMWSRHYMENPLDY
tara:strand:- start:756 stop:2162 length:1407 start_codon:yes stop_codon:yes gene_type:complete